MLNVALLEVESRWDGIERLKGEREVCVAEVAKKLVC